MELRIVGGMDGGMMEEREREERGRGFVGNEETTVGERRSLVEWRWGRAIVGVLCCGGGSGGGMMVVVVGGVVEREQREGVNRLC